MKRLSLFLVAMLAIVSMLSAPAMAVNLGYTYNYSDFNNHSSGVSSDVDSFMAGGVLGSGYANGSSLAGGWAITTHLNVAPTFPLGFIFYGNATQNDGAAIGGFDYKIATGNKNFLWIIPPIAGAIAGTEGEVCQRSSDGSIIFSFSGTGFGVAGSQASQHSSAGFIGADADLLIGKNQGPLTGSFLGTSLVLGETYSYSYKGQIDGTKFIGTLSGAGNSSNTTILGGNGFGWAGGSGQTSGGSAIVNFNPGLGSTSGHYSGQFSYNGNGYGNAAGYSQSYVTALPGGAIFGTHSGVSVNVGP